MGWKVLPDVSSEVPLSEQSPELGGEVSNLNRAVQEDYPQMGSHEVKAESIVRMEGQAEIWRNLLDHGVSSRYLLPQAQMGE